ncbi:hypothetical protein [Sphingomonas jaspsi]|uniref:hypothetical protein n=1 Tax=Sphingomonas jaspsi TaxID=392409 RepID=UPI0004B8AA47|nr:hypothetical protein [Sphingomonas jaspsi]
MFPPDNFVAKGFSCGAGIARLSREKAAETQGYARKRLAELAACAGFAEFGVRIS